MTAKMDPEILSAITSLLLDRAEQLLVHVPDSNGDLVVNALLGAAVNFAFGLGGTPSHLQTCFRKMSDSIPAMYRALAQLREQMERDAALEVQEAVNDNGDGAA